MSISGATWMGNSPAASWEQKLSFRYRCAWAPCVRGGRRRGGARRGRRAGGCAGAGGPEAWRAWSRQAHQPQELVAPPGGFLAHAGDAVAEEVVEEHQRDGHHQPHARGDQASAMPTASSSGRAAPLAMPSTSKLLIMPVTVPSSPSIGTPTR